MKGAIGERASQRKHMRLKKIALLQKYCYLPRRHPRSTSVVRSMPLPIKRLRTLTGICKHMLLFGRKRKPSQIVVLLHGLNDTAQDCSHGVVTKWKKGLPNALFIVPQSPDVTSWADPAEPGYDWVPTRRPTPWDAFGDYGQSVRYEASLKEYRHVLRRRCTEVDEMLDMLLCKYGLTNNDVVLAGFSLGAYLSSIVGARRNVRGVIVCGGMCTTKELRFNELMPKKTTARFCAVNGTKDDIVQRPHLEQVLQHYNCEWHWSRGVGHDFPSSWYTTGLKWMKTVFASQV